jgi:hypothetical protein
VPLTNPSNHNNAIINQTIMNETELLSTIGLEVRTRCEVWTRVMGYHRPLSAWNKGKQQEHRERCYFMEQHGSNGVNGS